MGKVVKAIGKIGGVLAAPFTGGASLALTGGLLGSKLLGGKKSKSSTAATGPVVMPLADDTAVAAKRKRDIATQLQRGGRSSTILSDSSDNSLGGGF